MSLFIDGPVACFSFSVRRNNDPAVSHRRSKQHRTPDRFTWTLVPDVAKAKTPFSILTDWSHPSWRTSSAEKTKSYTTQIEFSFSGGWTGRRGRGYISPSDPELAGLNIPSFTQKWFLISLLVNGHKTDCFTLWELGSRLVIWALAHCASSLLQKYLLSAFIIRITDSFLRLSIHY